MRFILKGSVLESVDAGESPSSLPLEFPEVPVDPQEAFPHPGPTLRQ